MRYSFLFLLFLTALLISALDIPSEPITVENAGQLQLLSELGYGDVRSINWRDDGNTLAINTSRGVWLHDMTNPDAPAHLQGDGKLPTGRVSPDGHLIVTRDSSHYLHFYDGTTGEETRSPYDIYNCGEIFSASWRKMAYSCHGGRVGIEGYYSSRRGDNIFDAVFSPDETMFFVVRDETVELDWCFGCDYSFSVDYYETWIQLEVSPDNHHLMVRVKDSDNDDESYINLWDIQANQLLLDYRSEQTIMETEFSHDGKYLVAILGGTTEDLQADISLLVWRMADIVHGHTAPAFSLKMPEINVPLHPEALLYSAFRYTPVTLEFSPDDSWLATTVYNQLVLWQITDDSWQSSDILLSTHDDNYAFHPNSSQLAVVAANGEVHIRNLQTQTDDYIFERYFGGSEGVALSPDERLIARAYDCYVEIWDWTIPQRLDTIKLCYTLPDGTPQRHIEMLQFADNQTLMIGAWYEVIVWDIAARKILYRFSADSGFGDAMASTPENDFIFLATRSYLTIQHSKRKTILIDLNRTRAATFSPDTSLLATATDGVTLWDTRTGEIALNFELLNSWGVQTLAFSPDGRYLAAGAVGEGDMTNTLGGGEPADGVLEVHDISQDGALVYRLDGHTEAVTSVAFSPDGTLLASSDRKGVLILWDMATGEPIHTLAGTFHNLIFSENVLVAGNTIGIWGIPTND